MGGFGSGRWKSPGRKTTTEECLVLKAYDFPIKQTDKSEGSLKWYANDTGKLAASIGFDVIRSERKLRSINLRYQVSIAGAESNKLEYRISMDTTPGYFGGRRFWLMCPIVQDEGHCRRRCAKLYLPAGELVFGCRHCHGLTYRSSQESHKWDAFYREMAGNMGVSFEEAKWALEQVAQRYR